MVSLLLWTQYDVWTGLQSWFVHGHWSQCSTQWSSCDCAQLIFCLQGERARRVANVSFPVLFCPLLSFTMSLSPSLLFLFFCAFLSFTYSMFPSLLLHVLPCPRPSLPTCLLRYFVPSFSAPSLPSLMPYFVSYFLLTCLSPFVFPTSFCASMLPLLPFAT